MISISPNISFYPSTGQQPILSYGWERKVCKTRPLQPSISIRAVKICAREVPEQRYCSEISKFAIPRLRAEDLCRPCMKEVERLGTILLQRTDLRLTCIQISWHKHVPLALVGLVVSRSHRRFSHEAIHRSHIRVL